MFPSCMVSMCDNAICAACPVIVLFFSKMHVHFKVEISSSKTLR